MKDVRLQRMELEALEDPVAILQAGTFAYANAAFLELVGVDELDELAAIPLLDLVSRAHHEALKKSLAQAGKLRPGSGEKTVALIEMLSQRGERVEMSVSAVPVEFDGEQCVQISPAHAGVEFDPGVSQGSPLGALFQRGVPGPVFDASAVTPDQAQHQQLPHGFTSLRTSQPCWSTMPCGKNFPATRSW